MVSSVDHVLAITLGQSVSYLYCVDIYLLLWQIQEIMADQILDQVRKSFEGQIVSSIATIQGYMATNAISRISKDNDLLTFWQLHYWLSLG